MKNRMRFLLVLTAWCLNSQIGFAETPSQPAGAGRSGGELGKTVEKERKGRTPEEIEAAGVKAIRDAIREDFKASERMRCSKCDADLLLALDEPDPIATFIFRSILNEETCRETDRGVNDKKKLAKSLAGRYREGGAISGNVLAQLVFWRSLQNRCIERDPRSLGEQTQNEIDELILELGDEKTEALRRPLYRQFLTEVYFAIDWNNRTAPRDGLVKVLRLAPSSKWEITSLKDDATKWEGFGQSLLGLREVGRKALDAIGTPAADEPTGEAEGPHLEPVKP